MLHIVAAAATATTIPLATFDGALLDDVCPSN